MSLDCSTSNLYVLHNSDWEVMRDIKCNINWP